MTPKSLAESNAEVQAALDFARRKTMRGATLSIDVDFVSAQNNALEVLHGYARSLEAEVAGLRALVTKIRSDWACDLEFLEAYPEAAALSQHKPAVTS